jgi:hypothetical protein
VNVIPYHEAIAAYGQWSRAVAAKPLPMVAEDQDDETNPLLTLAAKAIQIHGHRIEKGLPPRGELYLAVRSLATLCKISTLKTALVDVAHRIKGAPNMNKLERMVKHADTLLKAGELDAAEALIDTITKMLKARHRVLVEHDDTENGDDGDYSDDSNPSMSAHNNDSENNDDGETLDEDEEDDEEEDIGKASIASLINTNNAANRPGTLLSTRQLPTSYNTGVTQAVRAATPQAFDVLVRAIMARDGVTRTQAQARARLEHPEEYQSYQTFNAGSATNEQQSRRNIGSHIGKSAPPTFEDHVMTEMRKGVTREVAGQRVMQMYGNTLVRSDIQKSEIAGAVFENVADDLWKNDPSMSRTEALRTARRTNPSLFKRMQR